MSPLKINIQIAVIFLGILDKLVPNTVMSCLKRSQILGASSTTIAAVQDLLLTQEYEDDVP